MYPKRFIIQGKQFTVEFTSLKEGTVVEAKSIYKVGYHSKSWIAHTEDCWVPIKSKRQTLHNLVKDFKCT